MTDIQLARDPFDVLDLAENADDDTIQRRYLALVRRYPPERAPERFQEIRAAYEAVRDKRDRLRLRLLTVHGGALVRLRRSCLREGVAAGQPTVATLRALLREGADTWAASVLPPVKG